ncbi:MAG: nucleoside monophosphate kinase [Alphaproteobacteria bacterium]
MNKLVLMMGGQGSGKGTMSKKLLETNKNFTYIETGAMLRALPENSPLRAMIARGEMVPDSEVCKLLESKITSAPRDVLLDGFPRKLTQAQWLINTFGDKFATIAVYLNIPETLMLKRIQNRITEGAGRADDADSAAVRRRLDTFMHETIPAINWLRTAKNVKFLEIPIADTTIDANYATLTNILTANNVLSR